MKFFAILIIINFKYLDELRSSAKFKSYVFIKFFIVRKYHRLPFKIFWYDTSPYCTSILTIRKTFEYRQIENYNISK